MSVFYQASPQFLIEAIQQFGPNVIRFHPETGERRWYFIRCYLDPDVTSTIESDDVALIERPQGAELLVAGDLNADLVQLEEV